MNEIRLDGIGAAALWKGSLSIAEVYGTVRRNEFTGGLEMTTDRTIDWEAALAELTSSSGWESAEGPDSGVGESYWYGSSDGRFARLHVDQGHAELDLMPEDSDDDSEQLWSGEMDDVAEDEVIGKFVSSTPSPA